MARSRTARALFALLVSAAFSVRAELPANYPITLQTDSFPPFNMGPNSKGFARGDDVQGIAADTVRDIFRRAGVNLTLRGPWSRLYEQTQQQPAHGLFSVARRRTPVSSNGSGRWRTMTAYCWRRPARPEVRQPGPGPGLPDRWTCQRHRQPVSGKPGHPHQQQPQRRRKPAQVADRAHRPVGRGRSGVALLRPAAGRRGRPAAGGAELSQRTAVPGAESGYPDAVVNRLQKALDEVIAEGYAGCSKTPDLCYLIQNRGKTLAGSR